MSGGLLGGIGDFLFGSPETPAVPDYKAIAQEEAQASQNNLTQQNYANRPTQITPWGVQSWETNAGIDPATGLPVTQWTQNTQLNPALQSALDSQLGVQLGRSDLANAFLDRVSQEHAQPFDWANLPQLTGPGTPGQLQTQIGDYAPGLSTAFNFGGLQNLPQYDANYRTQVANDLFQQMAPVHRQQTQSLETDLSNRGFKVGTKGYQRALDDMQGRQAQERFNALNSAGQEAQRLYGMQMGSRQQGVSEAMDQARFGNAALGQAQNMDVNRMQAMNAAQQNQFGLNSQYSSIINALRQQAIAEQAQQRGMSLNEMNALLTGQQVNMPSMPSFNTSGRAETPQLLQAANLGYQGSLDTYNAQQQQLANQMSGLGSIASTAMMFSDRRLKRNIKRVGTHALGVGIYEYDMLGYPQRGVIAQELAAVRPDLVRRHASGYLMVNYGSL